MSATNDALKANEKYAQEFKQGGLAMPPAKRLAIIACMDARLSPEQFLGLKTGDAHIIRNAGGIVTEDAIRSLIISHHLLGTQEVIIVNHTDCGMLTFKDEELTARLEAATNAAAVTPDRFYAFPDLEKNVRQQIHRVKSHPWIPANVAVRGFIYDVKTGKLNEVLANEKVRGKSAE